MLWNLLREAENLIADLANPKVFGGSYDNRKYGNTVESEIIATKRQNLWVCTFEVGQNAVFRWNDLAENHNYIKLSGDILHPIYLMSEMNVLGSGRNTKCLPVEFERYDYT